MIAKHALVGGGTGFIGARLTKHLAKQGYDVTVISRMPGVKRITWHQLEKKGIPEGVTSVINVAGQNVLDPTRRWTPGFKHNVWNSRINTSAALAKAIQSSSDVKAFINISGVSHYRPNDSKIYTEYDKVEEFNFMSKLALEMEKAAALSEGSNCRLTIVRTGVVIGQEGGMIKSIMLPFQLGLGGPMGNGNQILPWIHIEDLCRLIQYCIENEKCSGPVNGVAPEIVTNSEFSKTFASVLRRPAWFPVPEFVVKTLFGEDRSVLLLTGAKVQPKRALELGFEFKYPTARTACEEVIIKK